MKQSYLERAKQWVETAEDIDIKNLELTLARFVTEQKKVSSEPMQGASKTKDLESTIEYLKSELMVLAGVDVLPEVISNPDQDSFIPPGDCKYTFDPSPLIDPSESPAVSLSEKQRISVLSQIKKMPEIISSGALIQNKSLA